MKIIQLHGKSLIIGIIIGWLITVFRASVAVSKEHAQLIKETSKQGEAE